MLEDIKNNSVVENAHQETLEKDGKKQQRLEKAKLVNTEIDRIKKKQEVSESLTPTEEALLFMATERQQDNDVPENVVEANQDNAKSEVVVDLNNDNESLFNSMPEGKKGLLRRIYEGIYKIPGVNKIVGKIEIAYNDLRINGLTNKERKLQKEIDDIDKEIKLSEKSQELVQSLIADAKSKGAPTVALEKDMLLTTNRIEDLSREKIDIQEELNQQKEQRDTYINKRREVADRLIGYYDEKIKPMEESLEILQALKSHLDFKSFATEIAHKKQEADLHSIEERLNNVKKSYRAEGRSENEIKKASQDLEIYLDTGKTSIQEEREKIFDDREEQEEEIAEAERLVALYKEKRDEFVRIKEGRQIENKKAEVAQDIKTTPVETISIEQSIGRLPVQSYISRWNEYLKNENVAESLKTPIDLKDFLEETGWSDDFVLDFEDFRKIRPKYLKLKGRVVESSVLSAAINEFDKNKT